MIDLHSFSIAEDGWDLGFKNPKKRLAGIFQLITQHDRDVRVSLRGLEVNSKIQVPFVLSERSYNDLRTKMRRYEMELRKKREITFSLETELREAKKKLQFIKEHTKMETDNDCYIAIVNAVKKSVVQQTFENFEDERFEG